MLNDLHYAAPALAGAVCAASMLALPNAAFAEAARAIAATAHPVCRAPADIEAFVREGCPHCRHARRSSPTLGGTTVARDRDPRVARTRPTRPAEGARRRRAHAPVARARAVCARQLIVAYRPGEAPTGLTFVAAAQRRAPAPAAGAESAQRDAEEPSCRAARSGAEPHRFAAVTLSPTIALDVRSPRFSPSSRVCWTGSTLLIGALLI